MTNAEKIRAMNDEELAQWLDKTLSAGREWFDARTCDRCQAENAGRCPHPEDEGCTHIDREIKDWLEAQADE